MKTAQPSSAVHKPSREATSVWVCLLRAQQALLTNVEADLKEAGFPPLAWYDALLELSRCGSGEMRPLDLEKAMLLPQYGTSRLIDRMERAGLVERRACPVDGRGQMVAITPDGRSLQKRMWEIYAQAIERHVGAKLTDGEAARLSELMAKLLGRAPAELSGMCQAAERNACA